MGIAGQSMLWHAEAGLGFRRAGGYVLGPEAPNPYQAFAIYPTLTYGVTVPHARQALAQFLFAEHVTAAAVPATRARPWVPLLEQLGWRGRLLGGVVLLRRPTARSEPAG